MVILRCQYFIVLNLHFLASRAKWNLFTSCSQFEILLRLVYLFVIELTEELILEWRVVTVPALYIIYEIVGSFPYQKEGWRKKKAKLLKRDDSIRGGWREEPVCPFSACLNWDFYRHKACRL